MADEAVVETTETPSRVIPSAPHGTGFGSTMVDPNPDKFGPGSLDENTPKTGELKADEKKDDHKAALDALRAEHEATKARLVQAEDNANKSQAYSRQILERIQLAASQNQQTTDNGQTEFRDRMNENPEAVLDEHFKSRIAPLAEMSLANQSQVNLQMLDSRMANDEDWTKYRPEVVAFMEKTPLELRAQPNSWDKAFNLVKSEHLDEIIERKSAKRTQAEKAAFVEPPSGGQKPQPKKIQLSDAQKEIAKGLDMTESEYMEWMR